MLVHALFIYIRAGSAACTCLCVCGALGFPVAVPRTVGHISREAELPVQPTRYYSYRGQSYSTGIATHSYLPISRQLYITHVPRSLAYAMACVTGRDRRAFI